MQAVEIWKPYAEAALKKTNEELAELGKVGHCYSFNVIKPDSGKALNMILSSTACKCMSALKVFK